MKLSKPVVEVIRSRKSCRTFLEDGLSESDARILDQRLADLPSAPLGNAVRVLRYSAEQSGSKHEGRVGTYGVIRGAKHYLVAAVKSGEGNLEDFGYVFECALLAATDLGLGTCWLGGTFRRGAFAEVIHLQEDEVMPAVSPVGYPREKRALVDTFLRTMAKSDRRKDWSELFFDGEVGRPLSAAQAGPWALPLEMLRLAPSASNRQPWRAVVTPEAVHFGIERTPGYARLAPTDLQRVDLGIGMSHFGLAHREQGGRGSWRRAEYLGFKDRAEYVISWFEEA